MLPVCGSGNINPKTNHKTNHKKIIKQIIRQIKKRFLKSLKKSGNISIHKSKQDLFIKFHKEVFYV